ncbi:MAG: flagellar basal-body rod protein FlgF [Deltaproteobacteria bacterium]
MDRGIYVALSGIVLQEKRMEILSDNIANVNTSGYKKQKPVFEDAMPDARGLRTFAAMNEVVTDMSQGLSEKTDRRLDVEIRGGGFFAVNTPNGPRYTRDGSFVLGADGTLMTREGYAVAGEKGAIKLTSPDVDINPDGSVMNGNAVAGKLKLVTFGNPGLLVREGSFFAAADPGVNPSQADPNTMLDQGHIETSNVNPVKAMTTMIEAMRSYETHSKMIQTIDDITKKTIDEVGRAS